MQAPTGARCPDTTRRPALGVGGEPVFLDGSSLHHLPTGPRSASPLGACCREGVDGELGDPPTSRSPQRGGPRERPLEVGLCRQSRGTPGRQVGAAGARGLSAAPPPRLGTSPAPPKPQGPPTVHRSPSPPGPAPRCCAHSVSISTALGGSPSRGLLRPRRPGKQLSARPAQRGAPPAPAPAEPSPGAHVLLGGSGAHDARSVPCPPGGLLCTPQNPALLHPL